MGDSGKGFVLLLLGGLAYAFFKLGDEFIILIDDLGILLPGVDEAVEFLLSIWDLQTVVLILVALFFIYAISDYITSKEAQ